MKQSTIIQSASFDEAEIEVSDILLNLKGLIEESESRSRVPPLTWSSKRRRSDRNLGFNSPCSSSPNSVQRNSQVEDDSDNVEIEPKSVKLKPEATSPDTPFSFSPSEFDHKPKQNSSEKSSKTKTREELMRTIEKLTRCREMLRGEVENVRNYYNSQKAYNLELKATRERVMTNLNEQGLGINIGQHFGISTVQPHCQHPFIVDHRFHYPMGQLPQAQPMFSSVNGLGFVNHTGPVGIPDLNVTLVEALTMNSLSPFDHNRGLAERKAQYAEARRKRRMKRIEIRRSSGLVRPQRR